MADLLAIISHERGGQVGAEALESLLADHGSLRGATPTRLDAEAGGVRACAIGRETPNLGIEREGEAWTLWVGSRRASGESMAAPLGDLDGQFALIRRNADGSVEAAADPLGMKPFFAATSGGRTYLSTSALVLAKHLGLEPSRGGIEAFLRSGLQFGRPTQWEGLDRLRPAEVRRFGEAGVEGHVYWQPRLRDEVGELDLGEAAALCCAAASEALASRLGGTRPWIDLTGGFDSRLLALLARRAGIDFIANTVGPEEEEDVRIARRVALLKGWPWKRFGLPPDWTERLPETLPEALAWGDGHLDALQLSGVLDAHRRKAEVESLLLNGGGGEEFRDHPWGHELLGAGRSSKVSYDRLIKWRLLLPVDLSPLRDDPTERVTAAFREELSTRVRPFEQMPNTFQGDFLYAFKMTGHSGAYQAAAGATIDLEVPFYLKPTLLNVISTALRHRRFHRLMRTMMAELDPRVAALPTETGGPAEPPRPGNLHRFAPYGWRRARRFAVRARGRLPGDEPEVAVGQPQAAQSSLIAALRREGRLDPATMRSAALYDRQRLTAMLDAAEASPMGVDWAAIGRIVTVELGLEAAGAGLG